MSATDTMHTRTNKRGSRGRADRPSQQRRHGQRRGGPPPRYVPEESAERYGRLFRSALLQAVEEQGSPVDPGALTLAYSRAALRTWDLVKMHAEDAERVRLQVAAEVRSTLGVERLAGDLLSADGSEERDEDDLRLPRVRARADRVRRGGKR